jgi:hypothetical protein
MLVWVEGELSTLFLTLGGTGALAAHQPLSRKPGLRSSGTVLSDVGASGDQGVTRISFATSVTPGAAAAAKPAVRLSAKEWTTPCR